MPRKKKDLLTSHPPEEAKDITDTNPLSDNNDLKDAASTALLHIIELAESETTDPKLRYDIYKWLCEMHFGKPGSSSVRGETSSQPLILSFEGELDKWSK